MRRLITGFFILFFLAVFSVHAEDTTVTIGGAKGWPSLSVSKSLTKGSGRFGQESLVLETQLPLERSADDLYLSFDSSPFSDLSQNYSIVSSALLHAGQSKALRGNGAALCNTNGTGLVLRGKQNSIFSTPGDPGSFSIEFWLYPAVTENGSVLFQWRSSRIARSDSLYQYIRSSLFQNHLEWTFSNVWTKTVPGKKISEKPFDVTIVGRKNLIPGQWSHHMLSFDANSGLLEYTLDGSTENIQYITSTGNERGEVYPALFGSPSDIEIGSRFSGMIDEFRIVRRPTDLSPLEQKRNVLDRYPSSGGRFETMPINTNGVRSVLKSLSVVQSVPPETGTAFFVRSGDNLFNWDDSFPEWVPARPGEILTGVNGRYIQVAGELYPDGLGTRSPSITSITLSYERDTLPWPPVRLFASPGNGSVTLSWPASIDQDAAGYLVYYGERPGEYLGDSSPADAGKNLSFVLDGLKNGKLYYFSVAAYDESGAQNPGTSSSEVYARPQAGL